MVGVLVVLLVGGKTGHTLGRSGRVGCGGRGDGNAHTTNNSDVEDDKDAEN